LAVSYANRGLALEDLIETANRQYFMQNIAIIHKVPSKWIPIRNKDGKIVTAKIETRSIVDFIGRYYDMPIAFDAKSVLNEEKWYLRNLEDHQYQFLKKWETEKSKAFVLFGFWKTEEFFFVPFRYIHLKRLLWKKGGPASIKLQELRRDYPVIPLNKGRTVLDYLSVIDDQNYEAIAFYESK